MELGELSAKEGLATWRCGSAACVRTRLLFAAAAPWSYIPWRYDDRAAFLEPQRIPAEQCHYMRIQMDV